MSRRRPDSTRRPRPATHRFAPSGLTLNERPARSTSGTALGVRVLPIGELGVQRGSDTLPWFPPSDTLANTQGVSDTEGCAPRDMPTEGMASEVPGGVTRRGSLKLLVADRYELRGLIGRGGEGKVYRAFDRKFATEVALKVVPYGSGHSREEARARFVREARLGFLLGSQKGIVRAFDWGEDDDHGLYLALDLVEGARPLDLRTGRLEQRVNRLAEAAELADSLHKAGFVHRDIKPTNYLLGKRGELWLTDFGLTKSTRGDRDEAKGVVTMRGCILGTPNYMAPEQFRDAASAGPSADVFALGVMLYQCLTGEFPFGSGNPIGIIETLEATRSGVRPTPRPSQVEPRVPARLDRLCAEALSLDPAHRPTASSFARSLRSFRIQPSATWKLRRSQSAEATVALEPSPRRLTAAGTERVRRPARERVITEAPGPSLAELERSFGCDLEGWLSARKLRHELDEPERAALLARDCAALYVIEERELNGRTRYRDRVGLLAPASESVFGREPECDLRVSLLSISRRQLRFVHERGEWRVEELGSSNGTRMRGETLRPGHSRRLRSGDRIRLSDHLVLEFLDPKSLRSRLAHLPVGRPGSSRMRRA